jgi:uncharacterized membrane protein YhhN
MNTLVISIGVLLLALLLYAEKKGNPRNLITTKSILSALFVLTAVLQPHPVLGYYGYLLPGLILCLSGDVCLALPQEKMFRLGLVAFLIGHVLYILAFSSLLSFSEWISPGAGLFFLASAMVYLWLRPHLGSMQLPVLFYILFITLMLSGAWAVFQKTSFPVWGKVLIFAGALCFYLSDIFVARDKFIKREFLNRLIGLPLYYGGQFMLAFSVGLLR